ncbi:MAG: hypothetical protein Tsb0016_03910 [Sphingomonadales bacterium]
MTAAAQRIAWPIKLALYMLAALVLCAMIGATAAKASQLAPIQAPKAQVLRGLDYLYDPSRQLSVRDLTRPAAQSAFKPFSRARFEADRRIGAHWFKFTVAAPDDRGFDYYLLFSQPELSAYTLFSETIPGNFSARIFDRAAGADNADVVRDAIGHRVRVAAGESRTYYLRLVGGELNGTLMQWQPRAWEVQAQQRAALGWIALGLAAMAAVIAALGRVLRGVPGIGWAVGYALAVTAAIFTASGVVFEAPLLWRYAPALRALAPALALAVFAGLVLQLLDLGRDRGRWWRAGLQVLAFAVLGVAVAENWLVGIAARALPWLGTALAAVALGLALVQFARRGAAVLWLSAIGLPVLIGGLAVIAQVMGVAILAPAQLTPLLWNAAAISAMLAALAAVLAPRVYRAGAAVPPQEVAAVTAVAEESQDQQADPDTASQADAVDDSDVQSDPKPQPQLQPQPAVRLRAQRDEPAKTSPASLIMELEARIGQLNRHLREREAELATLRNSAAAGDWIDPTTGITRRAVILDEGRAILAQALRYGRAVTVMLVEVEDYDIINQQLGQTVCDKAMKLLAISCLKNLRDADRLARYDERSFAAILPETDAIGAAALAKRLSQTLVERTLPTPKGMLQLSAVIAYTEFGEQDEKIEDLFARAARVLAEDRPGQSASEQAAAE